MSEEGGGGVATLLGAGTWTKQGPATLVVRENAWVVLVPGLRKVVIEAAWTVLGEKPAPEDFLDRLVEVGEIESADKLAALLFGFHDGTSAVFGVKGTTPIAVYTAEGSQQIAGTEEEPFVLRTLDGIRRVAFGDLPLEDGLGAPRLMSGIVPVRGFVHVTVDPADLEESERAALADQVEADGRSIEDPETKKRRAERPAPKPATPASTSSSSTSASRSEGATASTASRSTAKPSTPRSTPAPDPGPAAPNMFDGLFGGGAAAAPAAAPAQATSAAEPAPAAAPPSPMPAPQEVPARQTVSTPEPPSAPDLPAPAASSDGDGGASAAGPRRRLVSSSLFDRRHRAAAKAPQAEATAPAAEAPAPTEPATTGPATPEPPATGPAATDSSSETPTVPEPAPTAAAVTTPMSPAAGRPAAAPTPSPAAAAPTPESPHDEEDVPMPPPVVELTSPVTQVAPIDDDGEDSERPTPSPRRAPAPRHAQTASASGDLENTGAYDDLFGKTVFRRIEDAAVRRAEDDDHDEVEVVESTGKVAAPQETVPSDAPSDEDGDAAPVDEHTSSSGDFIDWVPGVGRAAPEIAQAAARRAAAPEAPEPAYPQVHMAERPPAPNTGSRPVPTRQPGPQTPYEQHAPDGHRTPYGPPSQQRQQGPQGQQGQYPQSAPFDQSHAQHLAQPGPSGAYPPYGGPLSSGAAGQQVGYQAAGGNPPQYHHQGPVNPGAAGDQLGFPGAQGPGSPQHSAARQGPAPQGRPAQRPAAPAPAQQPAPARGRHASAPHPVAPGSPASAAPGRPAAPQQGRPGPASAAGPSRGITLPGAVCANGHANPPERTACRVCGAPLSGQIRTVTRPPLGTVTISGGERFVLDRTAIIGRRPRASRVSANDVPQLITVPSPQQDISRSHLELRLEGWHVVALDLGTTNGTTLHREGFEPLRLRPSDGVVLHDGDHLDLGDDVHLKFGERT